MELSFALTALIFTLIGILLGILIRELMDIFYEWQEDRMWRKYSHEPVVLADWERELLIDDFCEPCLDGYHHGIPVDGCICCKSCDE